MNVIAFGASSSRNSINKALATYAASLFANAEVEILDLNDFEIPLFSEDREQQLGQPQIAKDFVAKLAWADVIIIAFAEHNGAYSAAYKNLFDWCSRITSAVFQNKPAIYLSASPGAGGAARVLAAAVASAGYFGADVKGSLSIPNFNDNFDIKFGILTNHKLNQELIKIIESLI